MGFQIGKKMRVNGFFSIIFHPGGVLEIGDNFRLKSSFLRNMVGGYRKSGIHIGKGGALIIGNNVGISNSTIVCMNRIEIEDDVLIGGDCKIYDTDFHSVSESDLGKVVQTKPIIIRRRAFIGAHSVILKGVTIGEKSIVGAGSVVTKNIPDGEVWGGNPIRFLKKIS